MAKKRLKKLYDMFWGYKLLRDASRVIDLTKTEKRHRGIALIRIA